MEKKSVYNNVVEAIGNTPIIRLNQITKDLKTEIFVKLEVCNPGGSVKDRIASYIIEDAEKKGLLKPGYTIVEATSGNTGVGLCMVAVQKGYKIVAVISDKQSVDKINTLKALGAEVVICPAKVEPEDPRSYYSVAEKLSKENPKAILANQYHNEANVKAHYKSTGPEIWEQMNGNIDYFVAGMGTGGTISGCSRFLKEKNPQLKSFGIDPEGSILANFHQTKEIGEAKSYLTEGIGEDIIPKNTHFEMIDETITVTDQEAVHYLHQLSKKEGIFVGSSSGAAVAGAVKAAKKLDKPGRMLVILPDGGGKYLNKFFNPEWLKKNNLHIE